MRGGIGLAAGMLGLVVGLAGGARAQNIPGLEAPGGAGALLPLGGAGYVPYSGGGGLGVYPSMGRMREAGGGSMRGIGMPGPREIGPARPRGGIDPLAPITGGAGMGASRGMGPSSLGRGMGRRPVGAYPFRQPPTLTGPAAGAGGAMPSM